MVWALGAMTLPHGSMCHYGMAVWGRGLHQELWYVVDGNVVNSTLYRAKQVVIKVGDLYGSVDNKMVYLSSQWMSILKYRPPCDSQWL